MIMAKHHNEAYGNHGSKFKFKSPMEDRVKEVIGYCYGYRMNLWTQGKISFGEIFDHSDIDFNKLNLYIYGVLPRDKAFKFYD